jgi:hypothetical protein
MWVWPSMGHTPAACITMERILYKLVEDKVVKIPLTAASRGSDPFISLPFKERMQKALYGLECEQGRCFRVPGYTKDQLRRVWWN